MDYYINNTNLSNGKADHEEMLLNGKASANDDPWKFKIERILQDDIVFLYQNEVGIVALGEADGTLIKELYEGDPEGKYSMNLQRFHHVKPPLSAGEIKSITGIEYPFRHTLFKLDGASGKAIKDLIYISGRA
ncbi:hypothetical protein [Chlorobium sp.]|uniref:hypothetical protein n=1 Tax=Chlorobium sp. TaxID=1095 RepID=UPI003C4F6048